MRTAVAVFLVCTNVQCNSARPTSRPPQDENRIQGAWRLVGGERNGEEFADEVKKNVTLIFKGNAMTTQKKDEATESSFTLHPETNPKGIDIDMDGSLGLGIYQLEGDALTIVHGEVDEPRPADFDAVKSGTLTKLVLQRAK